MNWTQRSKRWWTYFRTGHSKYLTFFLTFVEWVVVEYALLISKIPWLMALFPNLWIFVVIFAPTYLAISILVGRWDFHKIMDTESILGTKYGNPYASDMAKCLMLMCDGKMEDAKRTMEKWVRE